MTASSGSRPTRRATRSDEAGHRERFTVTFSTGMVDTMNYRRTPSDAYDDADALREWAALAIAAGQRAPKKKPKKR